MKCDDKVSSLSKVKGFGNIMNVYISWYSGAGCREQS